MHGETGQFLGTKLEYYTYDVYGAVTIYTRTGTILSASAYNNAYYFTGREYDTETSLYYYRARYNDPALGRFLETDPIGYAGGINLYGYVRNNPGNWVDPWGLVVDLAPVGPTIYVTPPSPVEGLTLTTPIPAPESTTLTTPVTEPENGDTVDPIPENSDPDQGRNTQDKGERGKEKGRGDDPYYGKPEAELERIKNDPNSTPRERERASRILKQKSKSKDHQTGKKCR